jgi:hypothetical protein
LVSNDGYYPQVVNRNKTNDANASYMVFDKDRAGAIVQSGDNLGNVIWRSFDGANYLQSAAIIGHSDGTPGTNDVPGRLSFLTTADGAAAPTERLRIASTGAFGLSGANYGTSGQVLTSGGSGAAPTWASPAGGGSMVYISTTTASGATYLDITGMDNTYDNYVIMGTRVKTNTDVALGIRILDSGSPVTSGSYSNAGTQYNSDYVQRTAGAGTYRMSSEAMTNSYEGNLIINIARNNSYTNGIGIQSVLMQSSPSSYITGSQMAGGVVYYTMNGIRIWDWGYGATNWLSGTFRLYGIKKS